MIPTSVRQTTRAAIVAATVFTALVVPAPHAGAATSSTDVHSVVILGDSVAAGEGTLDGFVYEDRALLPTWSRTAKRRVYDGPVGCRQSPRAYGQIVARELGATATSLACSGATFGRGIEIDGAYDRAEPDLVLVTGGANSVDFERVFAYCVLASRGVSDTEAARIASAPTISEALSSAVATAVGRLGKRRVNGPPGCTAGNPGAYVQRTVLDRIDGITADARNLANAIGARGDSRDDPEIVFTTYFDPLPERSVSLARCPDGAGLGAEQLTYMHQLVRDLNGALTDALAEAPSTRVADPGPAFAGHRWCDADPWVYGTSILMTDASSTAPFHPTPAGQRAIATAVLDSLRHGRAVGGPI